MHSCGPTPASIVAARKAYEQQRAAYGAELASKRHALLVAHSCHATGQLAKLRARLEADAKSLFALYEYGRLSHGCQNRS
jgi:hypothetical protein